jgi:hypothetical protein
MKRTESVSNIGARKMGIKFWSVNVMGRDNLEELGGDGSIILKRIFIIGVNL